MRLAEFSVHLNAPFSLRLASRRLASTIIIQANKPGQLNALGNLRRAAYYQSIDNPTATGSMQCLNRPLDERVSALDQEVARLTKLHPGEARPPEKDWRSTLAMFAGDRL
jgi:hypothetical protein